MKTSKNKTITINSSLAHISLALTNRKHFKAGFQNLLKILEASGHRCKGGYYDHNTLYIGQGPVGPAEKKREI